MKSDEDFLEKFCDLLSNFELNNPIIVDLIKKRI